jgi:hypothetical protein
MFNIHVDDICAYLLSFNACWQDVEEAEIQQFVATLKGRHSSIN